MEPVVLLHSSGMSSRQWQKLAERLRPTHRVLALDLIGSGSEPPWPADQPFHFALDVDRVATQLEALGEPAHLIGHSYGGFVGLQVARRAPTRIRSFAAYDPVAFGVLREVGDAVGLADLARAEGNPVFNDVEHGGDDAWFTVFVDFWNGPGAWRAMPAAARDAFLAIGRKVFWEVHTLMEDRTSALDYASIAAPVLFLTGEQTPTAAQRVIALLTEAMPHATTATIAGAGHMGPLTHHRPVNDALVAHLTPRG